MATRRPPVPKAKFTSSISEPTVETAAPVPSPATEAEGSPASTGRGKVRERQTTSKPADRHSSDGVIHSAGNSPVPARSFSGRLLVLGLAMGAVTLLLAPNVHTFLQQRAEISALRDDIAAKEVQQGASEAELNRWDDPAYIKQQARDRVSMLMPGETGYWVYGANADGSPEGSQKSTAATAAQGKTAINATAITVEPWVAGLWEAVQKSAQVHSAPATPAPEPAQTPTPAPETPAAG